MTFLPLLSLLAGSLAFNHSIDMSHFQGQASAATYTCLKENGFTRPIFLLYESVGKVNPYLDQMVQRAAAAQSGVVQYYIFPHTAFTPEKIVQDSRKAIKTDMRNPQFRVWIDVEGAEYWLGDYTKNCEYMTRLYQACTSTFGSNHCGVYANPSAWQSIFGGLQKCAKFSRAPLWWARYDFREGSDWAAKWANFGGWTKDSVVMKQYNGNVKICGTVVDFNIRIK